MIIQVCHSLENNWYVTDINTVHGYIRGMAGSRSTFFFLAKYCVHCKQQRLGSTVYLKYLCSIKPQQDSLEEQHF